MGGRKGEEFGTGDAVKIYEKDFVAESFVSVEISLIVIVVCVNSTPVVHSRRLIRRCIFLK